MSVFSARFGIARFGIARFDDLEGELTSKQEILNTNPKNTVLNEIPSFRINSD